MNNSRYCPTCGKTTDVINVKPNDSRGIIRVRRCLDCGTMYNSIEIMQKDYDAFMNFIDSLEKVTALRRESD